MMRRLLQRLSWGVGPILFGAVCAVVLFPLWVGFVALCVKVATAWGWLP